MNWPSSNCWSSQEKVVPIYSNLFPKQGYTFPDAVIWKEVFTGKVFLFVMKMYYMIM